MGISAPQEHGNRKWLIGWKIRFEERKECRRNARILSWAHGFYTPTRFDFALVFKEARMHFDAPRVYLEVELALMREKGYDKYSCCRWLDRRFRPVRMVMPLVKFLGGT